MMRRGCVNLAHSLYLKPCLAHDWVSSYNLMSRSPKIHPASSLRFRERVHVGREMRRFCPVNTRNEARDECTGKSQFPGNKFVILHMRLPDRAGTGPADKA